jgi:glycosyltransferase involved in cell wall biosynthesis
MGGPGVLAYGRALKLCTLHDYWFVCSTHVLWRLDREACTRRTCLRCTLAARRPPQLWRYTGKTARAARHVAAFIAGSRFSQRTHAQNGFPAPVHYLPHFLPEHRDPDSPPLSPHPRPYFLYVGRLETLKGPQTLVECFREYRKADLILVGNGTQEEQLRAQAADLPHVHFLGWVEHHRLRALYENAVAVLVPSLCYETFGLVMIEAFAAGTPAVARDFGALPEVLNDSGAGFLYSTNEQLIEAMETLRSSPRSRGEMAERARRRYLEEYTEAAHLERYYRLIDGVHSPSGFAKS